MVYHSLHKPASERITYRAARLIGFTVLLCDDLLGSSSPHFYPGFGHPLPPVLRRDIFVPGGTGNASEASKLLQTTYAWGSDPIGRGHHFLNKALCQYTPQLTWRDAALTSQVYLVGQCNRHCSACSAHIVNPRKRRFGVDRAGGVYVRAGVGEARGTYLVVVEVQFSRLGLSAIRLTRMAEFPTPVHPQASDSEAVIHWWPTVGGRSKPNASPRRSVTPSYLIVSLPPDIPSPGSARVECTAQQPASVHFMATIRGVDLPFYRSRQRVLVAVLSVGSVTNNHLRIL